MRRIIFLLVLLFPVVSFGQNFSGTYRAVFFNLFSEPRTIVAEFEVKADNSVTGQVKIGTEVKIFAGTVDKKGKFEAISAKEGNVVYKLKGKFDKDNEISFIRRQENGSGLNKSVSENGFEGTFAKVAPAVSNTNNPLLSSVDLADTGSGRLIIKHSNLFFGAEWTNFAAQIASKMNGNSPSWEIQARSTYPDGEQNITILFPKILSGPKGWQSEFFDSVVYRERKTEAGRNSFVSYSEIYKQNPQLGGGTLQLINESETQMVFKVSNLKVKRVGKDDFVEINGFIYADKITQ